MVERDFPAVLPQLQYLSGLKVQFHVAVIRPEGDKLSSINMLRSLAGGKDKTCLPNTEYKDLGKSLKFIIFSNSLTILDLLSMVQTRILNYWEYGL